MAALGLDRGHPRRISPSRLGRKSRQCVGERKSAQTSMISLLLALMISVAFSIDLSMSFWTSS